MRQYQDDYNLLHNELIDYLVIIINISIELLKIFLFDNNKQLH